MSPWSDPRPAIRHSYLVCQALLQVNGGGVRCLSSVLVSKKVGVVAAGMADGTASLHTIFFEKL